MSPAYSSKRLLLFVMPLCAIILSYIFLKKSSPFYLTQPDPCYAYLFNGMNLAGGNLIIGHIDHPGTTVQCFAAVVIFIKHLFSSQFQTYQDVILNPESYLFACSIVLIVLFVGINYLTGTYIFRRTGSIGLSMLFQITPLININIVQRAVILNPESVISIVSMFFVAYLFLKAPENEMQANKPLNNKTAILFGVFSGFLIATKYTCFPVVILVLFVLKRNKQRLIYMGMAIVSFLIFVIPALPKFKLMIGWVWSLITHDGVYGTGDERLINPSKFTDNLRGIFLADTVFTSIYIIITIAFLLALVNWVRKKKTVPFIQAMSGIWLSSTALIIAVAKHCDFHYLIFAECCFPLGLIISYKIISASLAQYLHGYRKYEKRILYSFLGLFIVFLIIEKIRYIPLRHPKSVDINRYADKYKSVPLIISINDGMASERLEPALFFANIYSADLQGKYAEFLNKIYPNTYLYLYYTKALWHWNEQMPIGDFLNKNKNVLMYLKGFNDIAQMDIIHTFSEWNAEGKSVQGNELEIFKNIETLQNVYLVTEKRVGDTNN